MYEPDPSHVLLLLGVKSAANWVELLDDDDKCVVLNFIENELNKKGDIPIKELLVMVLQQIGGEDSLKLINNVINQGEEIHGKYLLLEAQNAKKKMI